MYRPAYPLQTARLLIRPLRETDLDDLYAYHRRPDAVAYLPWIVRTREEVLQVIASRQTTISLDDEGDSLCLGVELRETGRIIGEVFLFWRSQPNAQGELGFVFHPDYHGKGYAREASERMLAAGFEEAGLHRIFGRCDARNAPSARLMGRLGMRLEAHFCGSQLFKGEWNEELVFAILRDEWLARRGGPAPSGQPTLGFSPTLPAPSILHQPTAANTMQFYVHHAGQQQGPFDLETVRARLADGSFLASDLAWREGMAGWQPLASLPEMSGGTATPPPVYPAGQPPAYGAPLPRTSGLAIASLVLGLGSFFLCFVTGLPAIICGHVSLSEIKRSGGTVQGRGMALTGLIIGYVTLLVLPMFFLAGIALPVFAQVSNKGQQTRALAEAKQLGLACKLYAGDHDGNFPASLEEIFPTYSNDRDLLVCHLVKDGPNEGYDYFGGKDTDPNDKILLSSHATTRDHKRIVIHVDCSGEFVRE